MRDARVGISVALSGRLGAFALDVAFEAPGQGVTALFGPSGSGKTSILRAVAGLQRLDGRVSVGGEVWQKGGRFVPPHRRALGYVFQEASLFPHVSVSANIDYGAKRTGGVDPAARAEIVDLLGIGPLLPRAPARLSGGERQRVALARAILSRPRILLMDEPLSALGAEAKNEILPYLERLHASLAIPILYVSHDLAEVERLADGIVVLRNGRVAAAGALEPTLRAAGLRRGRSAAAVLTARVVALDVGDALAEIDLFGQPLFVAGGAAGDVGTARRVRIEASDVSLSRQAPAPSTILNALRAEVVSVEESAAAEALVTLRPLGAPVGAAILARITRRSACRFAFRPGETVFAQVKTVSLATQPAGEAWARDLAIATGPDLGYPSSP